MKDGGCLEDDEDGPGEDGDALGEDGEDEIPGLRNDGSGLGDGDGWKAVGSALWDDFDEEVESGGGNGDDVNDNVVAWGGGFDEVVEGAGGEGLEENVAGICKDRGWLEDDVGGLGHEGVGIEEGERNLDEDWGNAGEDVGGSQEYIGAYV